MKVVPPVSAVGFYREVATRMVARGRRIALRSAAVRGTAQVTRWQSADQCLRAAEATARAQTLVETATKLRHEAAMLRRLGGALRDTVTVSLPSRKSRHRPVIPSGEKPGRFGDAPDMTSEEHQRHGDAATALWRELVKRVRSS